MNKPEKMTISPKGFQVIYKDGATQVIDNEGNQTITNAKLKGNMNKEKSKCCNGEVENECADEGTCCYRCLKCGNSCDVNPEKEEKKSKCCNDIIEFYRGGTRYGIVNGEKKEFWKDMYERCFNCKKKI